MRGRELTVATLVRQALCSLRREEQWQAASEGAALHQVLVRTGAGMAVTAAAHGQVQKWPATGQREFILQPTVWEGPEINFLWKGRGRRANENLFCCQLSGTAPK